MNHISSTFLLSTLCVDVVSVDDLVFIFNKVVVIMLFEIFFQVSGLHSHGLVRVDHRLGDRQAVPLLQVQPQAKESPRALT
jgi:hypothetical protein